MRWLGFCFVSYKVRSSGGNSCGRRKVDPKRPSRSGTTKKGKAENLRKALGDHYASASSLIGDGEEETVVPGATGEFYPYVYVPIETEPQLQG